MNEKKWKKIPYLEINIQYRKNNPINKSLNGLIIYKHKSKPLITVFFLFYFLLTDMAQIITARLSRNDAQPWGFRLQGGKDFGTPLVIQKVSTKPLSQLKWFNVIHLNVLPVVFAAAPQANVFIAFTHCTWIEIKPIPQKCNKMFIVKDKSCLEGIIRAQLNNQDFYKLNFVHWKSLDREQKVFLLYSFCYFMFFMDC